MFRIRIALPYLFLAIILSVTVYPVEAATRSFTVPSGEEITEILSLAVEDHVTVIFTVGGLTEGTVDFYMTFPNGTVKEFGRRASLDYRFICDLTGEYVLHFSNEYSTQGVLVTLNYEIQHYIFGIPQTLFFTLIIAAVCVAAATAFILMVKPR